MIVPNPITWLDQHGVETFYSFGIYLVVLTPAMLVAHRAYVRARNWFDPETPGGLGVIAAELRRLAELLEDQK